MVADSSNDEIIVVFLRLRLSAGVSFLSVHKSVISEVYFILLSYAERIRVQSNPIIKGEKTMSKFKIKELWNEFYGKEEIAFDYAGRLMLRSACGNPNSAYQPTIDHIRPLSEGGKDIKGDIVICHRLTNEEKADCFPHWKANGFRFHARRAKELTNGYIIIKEGRKS